MDATDNTNLNICCEIMLAAVNIMSGFASDFVPSPDSLPIRGGWDALLRPGITLEEIVSEPAVFDWLSQTIDSWPKELLPTFTAASSIIAQVLDMHGVGQRPEVADVLLAATSDSKNLQLMTAFLVASREIGALENSKGYQERGDPMGVLEAMRSELNRRGIAQRSPFARTLTTLLGQDALVWLTATSSTGVRKIQPHEFSRTGWHRIWDIENQLAIERELLATTDETEGLAKMVVVMSWTMVGLASFLPPAAFLGENTSHLLSVGDGRYTAGSGTGSHTLLSFQPAPMIPLIEILSEGLVNPLFSAADLMWIGAALARIRHIEVRHSEPIHITDEKFDLFLSHRGRDAKRQLADMLQLLPPSHGVFLDCMALPRGVINRSFIFGCLARSKRIAIADTENFDDSLWCRKEAWFAEAMALRGLIKTDRMALNEVLDLVASIGPTSNRQRPDQANEYRISDRVLRDIDYWARGPNLHSLMETGCASDALSALQNLMKEDPQPDRLEWVLLIGEAVSETLNAVVFQCPDGAPIDLWATALQLSIAVFGCSSKARSKDEVRRGVDSLNGFIRSFIGAGLHNSWEFRTHASAYLSLLAAAVTIQLSGFSLDPRMVPAVRAAIRGRAVIRDGMLLLDARQQGAVRTFRLNFAAELIRGNIAGVGIIQNAGDEVHERFVGDIPLEVLPCVTLHQGMTAPDGHGWR